MQEGQIFLNCPYCGSAVFVDKTRVVFHYQLSPTLNPDQALGALKRWMSGSQTIKDLDKKAVISAQTFEYFPLWYFRWAQAGREGISLEPAAATAVTEIRALSVPAGDLKPYSPELENQSTAPSVPVEAALAWLKQQNGEVEIRESSLVHVPVYHFKYQYQNKSYTALVEAGTGQVFANLYPAKAEAPYRVIGGITAGVYLLLALLAAFGGGTGIITALILAIAAAPVLFAIAAWVASKV